jgi:DNA-binding MarR family transcriptional regulator
MAIDGISQKMLAQQLRELERDGLVRRRAHDQVPPKVEYSLTDWGQSLCPALDALLGWIVSRGFRGYGRSLRQRSCVLDPALCVASSPGLTDQNVTPGSPPCVGPRIISI